MTSSIAVFACSDIEKTLSYYKDILGFDTSWKWGDPATFGGVAKAGISVMFNLQPELASNIRGHEHWFNVEDADEWYALHRQRGATIVSDIEDMPWGVREYVVEDVNGYNLRFAGPLSGNAAKSDPLPDGVRIEHRKPTADEFEMVAKSVSGTSEPRSLVLDFTWGGVVALSPNAEPIGVLRIMQDAPGWFSIWDVNVVPDWQGKNVGSLMMREALAAIKVQRPGAYVHLFTMKDGFYEKLGFTKGSVCTIQV